MTMQRLHRALPRTAGDARKLGELIAGAPMVIVAVFDASQRAPASEGDALRLISLGCVLENLWLAAQACHLDLQVMSTFSGEAVEPEVDRRRADRASAALPRSSYTATGF
jgi:nitroreductase family protein